MNIQSSWKTGITPVHALHLKLEINFLEATHTKDLERAVVVVLSLAEALLCQLFYSILEYAHN